MFTGGREGKGEVRPCLGPGPFAKAGQRAERKEWAAGKEWGGARAAWAGACWLGRARGALSWAGEPTELGCEEREARPLGLFPRRATSIPFFVSDFFSKAFF
jgi:hypothetical protein